MKLRNYILRKFGDNGCAVWVLTTRMTNFDCMDYAGCVNGQDRGELKQNVFKPRMSFQ